MVDIQTISIAVASASVVAGVVYYALQLRHQTRIRKTDLILRLYSKLSSPEFNNALRTFMNLQFKDYDDYEKKYGEPLSKTNVEARQSTAEVGQFFEMVGTLLLEGYVDLHLIYDVFGVAVIKMVYEKSQPLIVGNRKKTNDQIQGIGFEYLYNELIRKEPKLMKAFSKYLSQPVSDTKLSIQSSG